MSDEAPATAATEKAAYSPDDDLPAEPFDCLLCGHSSEAHAWWSEVPMRYVTCPACPDGLCQDKPAFIYLDTDQPATSTTGQERS